jgi:hypothetical protein
MNDTTNPTTATPAVNPTRDFINSLIDQFSLHIEGLVERKVIEIFQSHATMALIDEKTEERIKEIAKDLMDEHEGDYEHHSTDDISDTVATYVHNIDLADKVKYAVQECMSDGDYVTEDRVVDIVTDEIDFEEKVKEVLRNL